MNLGKSWRYDASEPVQQAVQGTMEYFSASCASHCFQIACVPAWLLPFATCVEVANIALEFLAYCTEAKNHINGMNCVLSCKMHYWVSKPTQHRSEFLHHISTYLAENQTPIPQVYCLYNWSEASAILLEECKYQQICVKTPFSTP